jgi:hypothetical protein
MAGVLIPNEIEFNKVVASLNKPPVFQNKIKHKSLSDAKLELLKEKVSQNVGNIHKRNEWLEASKRKNYTHEYDRLQSTLSVLNKDPNAIGIQNLKDRMDHLRGLVKESKKQRNVKYILKVRAI